MEKGAGSTKEEILLLLKRSSQLSVTELAKELGVTEMAVRRHISKLEKDEYIQATLVRQHVGRPTYMYQLSAKGEDMFPKRYKEFALDLLADMQEAGEEELIVRMLQRRAGRLKQQLQKRMVGKATLLSKLREIETVQGQNGFMTSLEQQGDSLFLHKQNCPLLSVARQQPILCAIEEAMYQELLPEAQVTTVSRAADGACACMYKIKRTQ